MKKILRFTFGAASCLLLAACTVTSDNPLSSPDTAQADPQLTGIWKGKNGDSFHFTISKAPWMHVEITPSRADEKSDSYDFYPTILGKDTFLNVMQIDKDDKGRPTKSYIFVRYKISSDHVLHMWMMSQDAAAAAVRAGKLKGIVHEDKTPMIVKQPSHSDVDVTLQDSSANIVKFIQTSGVDTLFNEKMDLLSRVGK